MPQQPEGLGSLVSLFGKGSLARHSYEHCHNGGLRCPIKTRKGRENGSNGIARTGLRAAASSGASRRLAKRPNRLRQSPGFLGLLLCSR